MTPKRPLAHFSSRIVAQFNSPAAAGLAAGLAFLLYFATAAPGLTWANYGADGGDLLAAALTNGTPHPTGYPFYTLLLQGWIKALGALWPASDLAWRGNIFSAAAASLSVALTAGIVAHLWGEGKGRSGAALLATGGWATAPMFWGQALITEVYTLHGLLFAALFWVVVVYRTPRLNLKGLLCGGLLGLGMAHHATLGLLIPGMLYWMWREEGEPLTKGAFWIVFGIGLLPGLLLYTRSLLVSPLTPVNWAGDGSLADLWWLMRGAAYQRYLFGVPVEMLPAKVGRWALIITSQFTPLGLALVLAGLYRWDRLAPRLRTLSLLWILPISLYAITYNTADSEIYLLPLVWLMAILLPFGVREAIEWLGDGGKSVARLRLGLGMALTALLLVSVLRLPDISLHADREAEDFLAGAVAVLEPGSLLFSSADAETFALWYGAWASGELLDAAPETVLVNVALLQFEWYRTLLRRIYPELAGVETGDAGVLLRANAGQRPIFFSEVVAPARPAELQPAGTLWLYAP